MTGKRNERTIAASERLYRKLMWLLPTRFGREYGDQMVQAFKDCSRDTLDCRGIMGLARLWCEALGDLLRTAAREHWLQKRRTLKWRLVRPIAKDAQPHSLTLRAQGALEIAATSASPGPSALLRGLISEREGVAGIVLRKLATHPLDCLENSTSIEADFFSKAVSWARAEARALLHPFVGTEHLLLGIMRQRSASVEAILAGLGTSIDHVRNQIMETVNEAN